MINELKRQNKIAKELRELSIVHAKENAVFLIQELKSHGFKGYVKVWHKKTNRGTITRIYFAKRLGYIDISNEGYISTDPHKTLEFYFSGLWSSERNSFYDGLKSYNNKIIEEVRPRQRKEEENLFLIK